MIGGLLESRGTTIDQLARERFRLSTAVAGKIALHRRAASSKAYNSLLFGADSGRLEVSREFYFQFEEDRYAPNSYYEGAYRFQKHYFPRVGNLESEGEEYECAVFLDMHPQVWYWVRNVERSAYSFWLQTSTDRFYPDFVVLLRDGRRLLVESKGDVYWSNDDSKEKRSLGEAWAGRSDDSCLFVMLKGTDWADIDAVINAPSKLAIKREGSLFQ